MARIVAEYWYDGSGNRVQQVAGGVTTTYANDPLGLTQVLLADDGVTQTAQLYGLDLIGQDDGVELRLLLTDGLGSVRQEMAGGTVQTTTTYDPYGKLLAQTGTSGTVYGYTGEQEDAATGLVYLRARYYNPNTNHFLTRDPFPGYDELPQSQNGYSYVNNNPVNLTDPSGRDPYLTWIEDIIQQRSGEIIAAANRHFLPPEFLAAVLYTENSDPREQALQEKVGDWLQQTGKFLFNCNPFSTDPYLVIRDLTIGPKTWDYFKFGRSQGIGAIKPEVALDLYMTVPIYNPHTQLRETIPTFNYDYWHLFSIDWTFDIPKVENEIDQWNIGITKHPVERLEFLWRLGDQSWSIEFLAAHLEAGRNYAGLASSDNSPDALKQMFAYHYNLDNDRGWNDPSHPAYQHGQNVLDLMPEMLKLLGLGG